MIEWLKIKNLALVQDAEIDFGKSLNIISGETGAGSHPAPAGTAGTQRGLPGLAETA